MLQFSKMSVILDTKLDLACTLETLQLKNPHTHFYNYEK